ncbi:hypothetical protein R1flu_011082 [Riccia fluitans]|uniref:Cytochrome P450 n=1 Tax=Riccia fluitans TaxID=41844 RepID=A0ABD1Z6Z3_9MARC
MYARGLTSLPLHATEFVRNLLGDQQSYVGWRLSLAFVIIFSSFLLGGKFLLKKPSQRKLRARKLKLPPAIPGGLPILGNVLQLNKGKPHETFTRWAQKYGPVFHVKTGSINVAVINSADLAKEIMVTQFDSVSTRRLPTALQILTGHKAMVSMSDYGEEYRMLKRIIVGNLLGTNVQRANRPIRQNALNLMIDDIFDHLNKGHDADMVAIRSFVQYSLFTLSMEQVFGYVPDSLLVEEFGILSTRQIFQILVADVLEPGVLVDWRNFFPVLSWVPNSKLEAKLKNSHQRKLKVISALIEKQKQQLRTRAPGRCYCDIVLTQCQHLTPIQMQYTIWEPIIESADTTLRTTESALLELTKNPLMQERLYAEIQNVAGNGRMVSEDDLRHLLLLDAIFKETLRYNPPVPILPARYVSQDIQVGGLNIPKDWDVLINIFGINWDPEVWKDPHVWNPDRCLSDKNLDLGIKDFRILSFGSGKRMCAGVQQAFSTVIMNIASLLQHFEFVIEPPSVENLHQVELEDKSFVGEHPELQSFRAYPRPGVNRRYPVN